MPLRLHQEATKSLWAAVTMRATVRFEIEAGAMLEGGWGERKERGPVGARCQPDGIKGQTEGELDK